MTQGAAATIGQASGGVDGDETATAGRPPVKAIKVLIPVWGHRYVRQFLEFCLPTLLAPGNLPDLAEALPCEFVLMTSVKDAPTITENPAWCALARLCRAKLQMIDDLITDGSHTVTITLAYARAVRETGQAMLDTCFVFLVSDWLVAAGSLANVLARIRAGASAVVAGNFQIVAEDAVPLLRQRLDPASPCLSLPPRELVRWSLRHLHPATVADVVNFPLSHTLNTNRLFWHVDDYTLIGRFYLMHMIAIRPEVTDFVIGASCDYSFVPEMCPSNNIVAMTDSDSYLVVEMQPRAHEQNRLRRGPLDAKQLAFSLAKWTTANHRSNIGYSLLFRSKALPRNFGQVEAQADAFIAEVTRHLARPPQPHRYHHYWIGSIALHRFATNEALSEQDWAFILGEQIERGGLARMLRQLRLAVLGLPPQVTRWHPQWPDYRLVLDALKRLTPASGRVLIVADRPIGFSYWLARAGVSVFSLETERLVDMPRGQYTALVASFDTCMLILTELELEPINEFVKKAESLLRDGGRAVLVLINNHEIGNAENVRRGLAFRAASLVNRGMSLEEVRFVPTNRWRMLVAATLERLSRDFLGGPMALLPLRIAASAFMVLSSGIGNILPSRSQPDPPRGGLCSSVLMVLRTSARPAAK